MSTDALERLLQPQDAVRRQAASRVKALRDVHLPRLDLWNYEPCSHHEVPDPNCEWRLCGGPLFRHQRTGTAWMYLAHKGILADDTGLGKSGEVIALIALLKQKQEPSRTIIVCLPGAIEGAWLRDFRRFAPRLVVEPAIGPRYERIERYAGAWDVLLIGYQMMLRDMRVLRDLEFDLAVSDDVQPLMHTTTQAYRAFKEIGQRTKRVIQINATPLNLRLQDLYVLSIPLGGRDEFGSLKAFERRYVRMEEVRELDVRNGRPVRRWVTVGYKHMDDFKDKFGPFYLRRTYDDVEDDVAIPKVAPPTEVWLDLHPRQRERYEEVQKGVVKLMKEMATGQMAEHKKYATAMTAFGYGAQVCSGLQNLGEPDGPGTSVKLDWLEDHVTGEWADEKIVVFSQYKGLIRAMRERFARHDIGMAVVWGDTPGDSKRKAATRKEEEDRFWTDPKCRIAVGTSAIERSLNFQIARIVVNVDQLMNPQRMIQILGRIRRAGSRHKRVYPFSLLAADTQEDRYLSVLEQRAALADYVFDGKNPLYKQLSPMELLHLIRP